MALEIASLTVEPDKRVAVTYAASGGDHASSLKLEYQLPGEEEFGHSIDVVRAGQTVGPFAPGALVSLRTHAGNSTDDAVLSAVVQVLIPA